MVSSQTETMNQFKIEDDNQQSKKNFLNKLLSTELRGLILTFPFTSFEAYYINRVHIKLAKV